MSFEPTEVAAVLADPTRFKIYEKLAQSRLRSYTVQEIAEQFSLHPNVARTHLSRLEEIGLVESVLEKSGRGGRPGKRYSASDRPVTLQFPRRDWEWLAGLLVRAVEALGPDALDAARELAYQEGLEQGRRIAPRAGLRPPGANGAGSKNGWPAGVSLEALHHQLQAEAAVQEMWQRQDGRLAMRFTTCIFRELAQQYPDTVCSIHRAYLRGIMEGALGPVDVQQQTNMASEAQPSCDYVVAPSAVARTA